MKKELEEYIGKRIKIVLKTGEVFNGCVDDTSDAEDNERPVKSIEIWEDKKGGLWFYEDEIEIIEIQPTRKGDIFL